MKLFLMLVLASLAAGCGGATAAEVAPAGHDAGCCGAKDAAEPCCEDHGDAPAAPAEPTRQQ